MSQITDNNIRSVCFEEIIREVSSRTGVPIYATRQIIREFVNTIKFYILNRYCVRIPNLGKFFVVRRKAGIVPVASRPGKMVWVKERYLPKFVFYNQVKDQVVNIPLGATTEELERDALE